MLGNKETLKSLAWLPWAVPSVQWEERGRGESFAEELVLWSEASSLTLWRWQLLMCDLREAPVT